MPTPKLDDIVTSSHRAEMASAPLDWTTPRLAEVKTERERQDEKWGEQNHPPEKWLAIIMEELGEASQACLQGKGHDYRQELIEVAACAVAAVECHDRLMYLSAYA